MVVVEGEFSNSSARKWHDGFSWDQEHFACGAVVKTMEQLLSVPLNRHSQASVYVRFEMLAVKLQIEA